MLSLDPHLVGVGQPTYVIAEIGLNHNGDVALAQQLIDVAVQAGCQAVKFQKRTPEQVVPLEQRDVLRDTPWGRMTYLDYRHRIELGQADYEAIDHHCRQTGIAWFASPWDVASVAFLEQFQPVCHKVASACLTDGDLLDALRQTGRPILLSTGMSTMDEIHAAVARLDPVQLVLLHTTSAYPAENQDLNLRMIQTLQQTFHLPVGYSGHERGLQATLAAVALGACVVERHITLDRTLWGTDQAASLEPRGLNRLVRDIRVIEQALGDGVKRVTAAELPVRAKLRKVLDSPPTGGGGGA